MLSSCSASGARAANACHPERTREGSGLVLASQILRGVPLRMTGVPRFAPDPEHEPNIEHPTFNHFDVGCSMLIVRGCSTVLEDPTQYNRSRSNTSAHRSDDRT